jgi:hypothetical protein
MNDGESDTVKAAMYAMKNDQLFEDKTDGDSQVQTVLSWYYPNEEIYFIYLGCLIYYRVWPMI